MLRRFASAVAIVCVVSAAVWIWFRPPPISTPVAYQPAQFVSELTWSLDADWFGGFSGLELSADGQRFFTVTDRGHIASGTLSRGPDGLSAVTLEHVNTLADDKGRPLRNPRTDAEGLALSEDGTLYVSFERVHRVWIYDTPTGTAQWASYKNGWRAMATNGGMEGVAIDAGGTLFAPVESAGKGAKSTLVYTRSPSEKWQQPFVLPVNNRFLPVGADFGPDGRLYVLERDVYPFGFRSRIRALTLRDDKIASIETVMETPLRRHGNLEGLAVWTDTEGRIRLTMIADDNFLPVQRTQIVDYVLTR